MKTSIFLFFISLTSCTKKLQGEKCIIFSNDYQVSDRCVDSKGDEVEHLKCCRAYYTSGLKTSFNLCTNTGYTTVTLKDSDPAATFNYNCAAKNATWLRSVASIAATGAIICYI